MKYFPYQLGIIYLVNNTHLFNIKINKINNYPNVNHKFPISLKYPKNISSLYK